MRAFRNLAVSTAAAMALLTVATDGRAQTRLTTPTDSATKLVTVVPGASYGAGPLTLALFGSGWRDIWLTPITAPVLDIGTYAGGLKIDKRGGGFQTITLHMTEKDGWKEYRFRSVDKFPMLRLPPSLQGTTVGNIIQDQTSSQFPAAPLLAPPFVEAIGGLQVAPKLYVMADDPILGEHRAAFGGLLGTMELKGQEAPDDKPGFAGSSKIKDTDKFLVDLYEDRGNRLDEREMLAVRLVDFLINDGDRTPDNYAWARFGEKGNYQWRPISRDRDRAFTDAKGIINKHVVRRFYPKFTEFAPTYSLRGLMASSYIFDRQLLQRLTAEDFAQIAREVQAAVTDSVIEASIANLPREWRDQTTVAERLRTTLKARRALLPDITMAFYEKLAGEPDIHLTGDNERADIVRHTDGRVTVTVPDVPRRAAIIAEAPNSDGGATRTMGGTIEKPFYQRTFLPSETKEIRVYLGKGDDVAVIRGAPTREIIVRVVGDSGSDVLADSAGGGATYFYDAEGNNQFVKRADTHVSEKEWDAPEQVFGFAPGSAWRPDWGTSSGFRPVFQHKQGAGLVLGVGPRYKAYGFRRLPHWWEAKGALLYGTGNGRFGLTTDIDYRTENSPLAVTLAAKATKIDAFRFYGYGNDSPDVGSELSLIEQTVLSAEPAIVWHVGWRGRESRGDLLRQDSAATASSVRPLMGRLQVGPVISWTDPEPLAGSPLTSSTVVGGDEFGQVGAKLAVDLNATDRDGVPTRGWNMRANIAAYPAALGLPGAFTAASALGAAYLPLGLGGANLALRAGGAWAAGEFPAQYAATIGGSSTVRGYRSKRFAGDAAANATSELRIPIGTVNFMVRSKVGVLGLADVGRVWFDGQSDGGWHTGVGGGMWVSALGRVVSLSYAKGDSHRFYLKGGLGF